MQRLGSSRSENPTNYNVPRAKHAASWWVFLSQDHRVKLQFWVVSSHQHNTFRHLITSLQTQSHPSAAVAPCLDGGCGVGWNNSCYFLRGICEGARSPAELENKVTKASHVAFLPWSPPWLPACRQAWAVMLIFPSALAAGNLETSTSSDHLFSKTAARLPPPLCCWCLDKDSGLFSISAGQRQNCVANSPLASHQRVRTEY